MDNSHNQYIQKALVSAFGQQSFKKIETVQTLWSGYGEIARYQLGDSDKTVIVKCVNPQSDIQHPRGWHSSLSHQRKLSSYKNEQNFYSSATAQLNPHCRVPECLGTFQQQEMYGLLLEDLDAAGYPQRTLSPDMNEIKLGLNWLANFHACTLNAEYPSLWPVGTYWHLATRPDEFNKMPTGELKTRAAEIDNALNGATYRCLVHGDAKVANLGLSDDFTKVSAVDFQYVGGGVGVKDVAYFLGSCLDDAGLQRHAANLVDYYFECLRVALSKSPLQLDQDAIISEWTRLYPLAWADFERFLLGWAPEHKKLTPYSQHMTSVALQTLS